MRRNASAIARTGSFTPVLDVVDPLRRLVCFDIANRDLAAVVDRLYDRAKIVASVTPYAARHVRLGPSILNSPGRSIA